MEMNDLIRYVAMAMNNISRIHCIRQMAYIIWNKPLNPIQEKI